MSHILWKHETLSGWGRASRSSSDVAYPADLDQLVQAVADAGDLPIVARGAGRSYGDTALNRKGRIICCSELRRIHAFDPGTGGVVVEPGVTFGDLLDSLGSQGWIPPVTPGTQFATIGGAIANDVHGKNHDSDGSICDHVLWLDLVLPDGCVIRVSPDSSPEIFFATCGGIGLTGFIARACLRMKRVPGNGVLVQERRARDLAEYLDLLEHARSESRYSVGWIDGVASGARMGRGILETADHTDQPARASGRWHMSVPAIVPAGTINRWTVRLFNEAYFRRVPAQGRRKVIDFRRFFYPLDALDNWNNLYGRPGFMQFQCVIPDAQSRTGIRTILSRAVAARTASFLAVIKTMGREGRGYLSFPMKGVTLALDFPMGPRLARLFDSLHAIVTDFGGRVYLAKDGCLRAEQFRQMYPRLSDMQAVRSAIDPHRRLRSDMATRLGL